MLHNLAQDMAVRCLVEELQRAYATLEAVPRMGTVQYNDQLVSIATYSNKAAGPRLVAEIKKKADMNEGERELEEEGLMIMWVKRVKRGRRRCTRRLHLPKGLANPSIPWNLLKPRWPLTRQETAARMLTRLLLRPWRPSCEDLEGDEASIRKQPRIAELQLEAKRLLPGSSSRSVYDIMLSFLVLLLSVFLGLAA